MVSSGGQSLALAGLQSDPRSISLCIWQTLKSANLLAE